VQDEEKEETDTEEGERESRKTRADVRESVFVIAELVVGSVDVG
jgi:hypothetical protein